ncbi:MAG: thioredoxin family protein, partial [Alphaproteobacteria bacterium]|nr:thioredoxin family protein [Alphaproteobacteria bacterium]
VSAGRPGTAPVADFAAMLAVALLGGLVLNLMPCVLPVLSLKVLALIGHGGGESAQVRRSFIASAAGILFSFLVLAAATVAMKAAGSAVGWGIQFQHPLFLIIMVALLTLFAANLWGVFEFSMPHWMMGVGAGHGSPHSLGGHFLTGAFATLLSTPCTAPFLGTAIGFALARGPMEIVSIFTALGLGMASPYLAVAALPSLATRLPRPGRWMLRVKAFMGVLLAGTAVWLLTVLAALTGGGEPQRDGNWIPFDPSVLAREVAGGRNVFVDVTADWCVTCKVNKAAVIDRDEVTRRLREGGWIAMRADWTRPDDGIAAYLASFGRYGVPFNAVYGPGAPRGLALPELLTVDAVLAAMERASHQPETTP